MTSTPTLDTVHATCRYGPHAIRRGVLSTDGPWYADVTGGGDGIDCGGSPTGLHAPADGVPEFEKLRVELAAVTRNWKYLSESLANARKEIAGRAEHGEQLRAENVRLAGVVEERSAALGLALHREEFSKGQHAVTRERLTDKERELAEAKSKLHNAAMVKVWKNEDGKRFVFADDLCEALLPEYFPQRHEGAHTTTLPDREGP